METNSSTHKWPFLPRHNTQGQHNDMNFLNNGYSRPVSERWGKKFTFAEGYADLDRHVGVAELRRSIIES